MKLQWINCLSGVRGEIEHFPAEMLSEGDAYGIGFTPNEHGGISVVVDFRANDVVVGENCSPGVYPLEMNVPVIVRVGETLLAVCMAESRDWSKAYRFPLWTIFDAESLEVVETVREPSEVDAAVERSGIEEEECFVSPYGLPLTVPLSLVADLFESDSV